jgi:hypothetical protein
MSAPAHAHEFVDANGKSPYRAASTALPLQVITVPSLQTPLHGHQSGTENNKNNNLFDGVESHRGTSNPPPLP